MSSNFDCSSYDLLIIQGYPPAAPYPGNPPPVQQVCDNIPVRWYYQTGRSRAFARGISYIAKFCLKSLL